MSKKSSNQHVIKIGMYIIIYAVICQMVSLYFIKFNLGFTVGIVIGICVAMVNLYLMGILVNVMFDRNRTKTVLLEIARVCLYAIATIGANYIGYTSTIGFAVGVLGIVFASAIYSIKEGKR